MELADAAAAAFADVTGRPPEGVWRAPGRVNLIGEHTDYNDGFVLPVAIDRSVVVAAGRRGDGVLRCWSTGDRSEPVARPLSEVGPGTSTGWSAYVEGVAWVLLQQGVAVPGVDLAIHADLPAGAGLSSSAALEAAVALALTDLASPGAGGAGPDRVALALAGQRAETEVVGMPCGLMDQMAVLCARAGHALFFDTRTMETEQVPFDPAAAGLTLLVIDTRVKHQLAGSPYAERRRACERAAAALGVPALRDATLDGLETARAAGTLDDVTFRRARHVVTENARVLEVVDRLRRGQLAAIGPALAGSHRSLRDDYEVSCPELDLAVDTAVATGAVAARMTGAGFGGSALALVPVAAADAAGLAVAEAFTAAGFAPPATFPVAVAGSAARLV
ncbi:MAG TPA: galactokinase [Acidimicrobiia bacterium]|nr:galactokinase [Acidimicrobiia bacterium]